MMRGINRQRIFEDTEDTMPSSSASAMHRSSIHLKENVCLIAATTMRMPLALSWLRPLLENTFHVLNTKISVAEACQTIRSCYTSLKYLASTMVSSCNVSTRNNAMPFFPHC